MSEYKPNGHALDWDDGISNDGKFILLEEGDYNFTVTGFERGSFPGSSKISPCNKATLTLTVDTDEGSTDIKYDLILWSSLEWKISEFFRAIGQKQRGQENFRPNWNEVVGAKGRARFKIRTYTKKDGTTGEANDVDKMYDYNAMFFNQKDWVADAQKAEQVPAWKNGAF